MSPHLRLLLLLLAVASLCQGAPLAGELRCRCVRTVSEVIPPRRLARLEFLAEGPHCAVPEVIATMKQGQLICLDPAAPWVKLLVTRILRRKILVSYTKNVSRKCFFVGEETAQQVVRESIHKKCLINWKSRHSMFHHHHQASFPHSYGIYYLVYARKLMENFPGWLYNLNSAYCSSSNKL